MSTSLEIIQNYVSENKGLISVYFIINIVTLFLETIILSYVLSSLYSALNKGTTHFIYKYIIIFFLCLLFIKIGYMVKSVIYNKIIPTFFTYVKTLLYEEIVNRYKTDFKELNLGFVQYNYQNLPYHISRLVIELLQEYIPNTIAILFCVGYLLYINFYVGLVAIVGLVLVAITIGTRFKNTQELSIQEHEDSITSSAFIDDHLNNLFNIYLSGTEDIDILEQASVEKQLEDSMTSNYKYVTDTSIIVEVISICMIMCVLFFIYKAYKSMIPAPTAILIIILMNYYTSYLTKISQNLVSIVDTTGFLNKVNVFLSELNEPVQNAPVQNMSRKYNEELPIQNLRNTQIPIHKIHSISFKNVYFSYNENSSPVVSGLNFDITNGQKIAIYGQSGSGKSTIIKLLLRFYEPSSGYITVNDTVNMPKPQNPL